MLQIKLQVSFSEILSLPADEPNKIYAYASDSDQQFAELWLPERRTRVPVVMLIHGGCWESAFDLKHAHGMCTAIKNAGMAVWSLEYRRIGNPGGGWPGTFSDVLAGLQFLVDLDRPEIDYQRKALLGHSAGGHLALWAAAAFDEKHPFQDSKVAPIKMVMGLAAISDLASYAVGTSSCEKSARSLMGGLPENKPDLYRWASPMQLDVHPDTVLVHGDKDPIVNFNQSEVFARSKGAQLARIPDGGHFDLIHPGSTAWPVIIGKLSRGLSL